MAMAPGAGSLMPPGATHGCRHATCTTHPQALGSPPALLQPRRTHRRHTALHAVSEPLPLAPELERLQSVQHQPEIDYQPIMHAPPRPQSYPKRKKKKNAKLKSAYDIEGLLSVWDRGVRLRTEHLMSQLAKPGVTPDTPAQPLPPHIRRASRVRITRPFPKPGSQHGETNQNSAPRQPTRTAATKQLQQLAAQSPMPIIDLTQHTPTPAVTTRTASPTPKKSAPRKQHVQASKASGPQHSEAGSSAATAAPDFPDTAASETSVVELPEPGLPPLPEADLPDLTLYPALSIPSHTSMPVPSHIPAPSHSAYRPTDWTVDAVLRMVHGCPLPQHEGRSLDDAAREAPLLYIHNAVKVLGKAGNAQDVERLLAAVVSAERYNSHTWGTCFLAFAEAGRLDLALSHLERTCRRGIDIGPVGASCLVKIAAQNRDLDLALDLYYKMGSARVTFNRYVYNCIIHLCGVLGRANDALDMLTNMQTEAQSNSECSPDCYTYSALLYAIRTAKRYEHLNNVFFALLEAKIDISAEVWCQLLHSAGRAGRVDWAQNYWKAYRRYGKPQIGVYNAYLWTLCKAPNTPLDMVFKLYHHLQQLGLTPDSYTYVALLSALSKEHCELQLLERVMADVRRLGLPLNTQLGTALMNAYKRVPELTNQVPGVVDQILARVDQLMNSMVTRRVATAKTFAVFATLYILAGRVHMLSRIVDDAARAGCPLDRHGWHHLHVYAAEVGLVELSEQCRQRRDELIKEQRFGRRTQRQQAERAAALREMRAAALAGGSA